MEINGINEETKEQPVVVVCRKRKAYKIYVVLKTAHTQHIKNIVRLGWAYPIHHKAEDTKGNQLKAPLELLTD